MMRAPLIILGLLLGTAVAAQDKSTAAPPAYDAALAERLGADARGMKSYVFVVLKTGPKTGFSKEESAKLFQGHIANIKRLAAEGKLAIAGPFEENPNHYEGLFIFNVKTVKEAEALVASDPAVAAGRFSFEAYGWYGSAALMETNAIHNRIDKSPR
jgi:uncharacterized protein YciI